VRAGQIIRQLRGFIACGDSEKRVEPVAPLIREATELALLDTKQRGIRIRVENRPGYAAALADKIQIQQVLLNLLRNAAEMVAEQELREVVLVGEARGRCR
jgi:two-component system sensor kinase FixL